MSNHADPFPGAPSARMLLLGAFHFQNPGLDAFRPKFTLDVFSRRRQQEIAALVERLAAFEPTRLAVETAPSNQAGIDRDYQSYLRDEFELPANEIFQLGFRLARRVGHRKVNCIDASDRHYQPRPDPATYAKAHGQEHLLEQWWPRYRQLMERDDAQMEHRTLREIFLRMNDPEAILQGHGMYLVDSFKVGTEDEYPGPDRVTSWYNRNLRIFANLQRITEVPDERILCIIGAGHLPILRHCVQASPEYELVEVRDYLGGSDCE